MNTIDQYFSQLNLPDKYSHKGQNGKLLIIGGSELFHSASKWSLDIASKFVDMVFYGSIPSNNELIKQAKLEFWNGIVIERNQILDYIEEADVVLIGPGMERSKISWTELTPEERDQKYSENPTEEQWQQDTETIVNFLVKKFPDKKWVVDAGALQMVVPYYLGKQMIITPHQQELERIENLIERTNQHKESSQRSARRSTEETSGFKQLLAQQSTILLKGTTDYIYFDQEVVEIEGGNPGMTKGGTGDVLAGLVAALYCSNSVEVAAVIASYTNKQAGEKLAETVGPFFNASDLVEIIPRVLWQKIKSI